MRKPLSALLFTVMALLFLIANRGAYKGYFQDDELDNIFNARRAHYSQFLNEFVSPKLSPYNFRPLGHGYFAVMARTANLQFPSYIAVVHFLHLLNVLLVWLLLRRLGFKPLVAGAGALFFAFHMAAFDAYWKPMYVFDVLCATFCLLTLLTYARGWWIFSLVFFWMAYKSKELAVMLPVVLLAYEFWLGGKRWKRLIPFFAISALFGIQAVWMNSRPETPYTLHFTPGALVQSAAFYLQSAFLMRNAIIAALASALIAIFAYSVRDKRIWFGLASAFAMAVPMFALPGRLFSTYIYVPLAFGAVAFAGLAAYSRFPAILVFFLIWIPLNYSQLREKRKAALTLADQNRAFVTSVSKIAPSLAGVRAVVFEGKPPAMQRWGVEAAFRDLTDRRDLEIKSIDDIGAYDELAQKSVALVSWDYYLKKMQVITRTPEKPDFAYIRMSDAVPIWQLGQGWYTRETLFRWTAPHAEATLYRPPSAQAFELVVNVGPDQIKRIGQANVKVLSDGVLIGAASFDKPGIQTVRWPLKAGAPGNAKMTFDVAPALPATDKDPRVLGIAVCGFGFK